MTDIDQLSREMLAQINRDEMRQLEQLYPDCTWAKFFDVERFVMCAAEKALNDPQLAGWHSPIRMLDLGSGFGYFPLAAQTLGHEAVAFEPQNKIIDAVSKCVPIPWVFGRINRREMFPLLPGFDLVTMTGVNLVENGEFWSQADYEFLIDDVLSMLRPGGRFIIEYNRGPEHNWLAGCLWSGRRHESVGNRIVFTKE